MIDTILIFINQGWVGASIGIVGIIIGAILSYKFSIKKPIPAYQKYSLKIIKKDELELSKNIQILYDNKQINNLTKIKIIFWNHGTDTLRIENMVEEDPLLFQFSDNTIILNSKIIKKTRDINKSYINTSESKPNIAYFGFDYLDQNDGMIFEIIHTDIKEYPKIKGTFKGIPEGIQNFGQVNLTSDTNCKRKFSCLLNDSMFLPSITSLLGIIMIFLGIYPSLYIKIQSFNSSLLSNEITSIFFIIAGISYIIFAILIFWQKRKRFPKKLILLNTKYTPPVSATL